MVKNTFISILSFACFYLLITTNNIGATTFQINNILVEGNNRISNSAISNYSELNLKTDISAEDLNKAYTNIVNTNLFKLVKFDRRGGLLKIIVEEYPTVNNISFEGNNKFTDANLAKLLTIKPRFVFTPSALEKDLEKVSQVYQNSGRISARITPKIINLSDNRVNVIFEIFEGSVTEIERISFVGNRAFSDRRLRRALNSKQAGILRKLITRDTLVEDRIELDKRLLTDFYRSRGYADFEIFDVNAELSEELDGFFISYNIKEGPQFKVGQVRLISEVKEVDQEELLSSLKLKSGQIFSPVILQSSVSILEDQLRTLGHDFVTIEPNVSKDLNNLTLDIDLKFIKGKRVFVERIDITGNTATFDRVLRRQFFIIEGDPFNPSEILAASERIKALGLFSDTEVKVRPGTSQSEVIIDVRVSEKPTGSLSFGAGYSSANGLGGIIEYEEKNFLGRGQSLSFGIKTGKDDQLYDFSFFEPMFLRNDLGFGVSVSLKDTKKQNSRYDTSAVKFQPYLVFPIGSNSKLKFDFSIEETDLSNPGNVGSIISSEVNKGKASSVGLGYAFTNDSRLYKRVLKMVFGLK